MFGIVAGAAVGICGNSGNRNSRLHRRQGREAITLLNQYKTGTAESLWDNTAKTLTLWGVDFTTTAQTAVKLPAGSTIVLKDGTHNTIQSGDVSLEVSGGYSNATYINALDAAGSLTIEGGTAACLSTPVR